MSNLHIVVVMGIVGLALVGFGLYKLFKTRRGAWLALVGIGGGLVYAAVVAITGY